jgi:hypothetical protein
MNRELTRLIEKARLTRCDFEDDLGADFDD